MGKIVVNGLKTLIPLKWKVTLLKNLNWLCQSWRNPYFVSIICNLKRNVWYDRIPFEFRCRFSSKYSKRYIYCSFRVYALRVSFSSHNVFCQDKPIPKDSALSGSFARVFNSLSDNLPTNCLSVFDHFVNLAFKVILSDGMSWRKANFQNVVDLVKDSNLHQKKSCFFEYMFQDDPKSQCK